MIDFWAFKLSLMASSMSLLALALEERAEVTAEPIAAEVASTPSVEGSGFGFFSVDAQPTTKILVIISRYLTIIS